MLLYRYGIFPCPKNQWFFFINPSGQISGINHWKFVFLSFSFGLKIKEILQLPQVLFSILIKNRGIFISDGLSQYGFIAGILALNLGDPIFYPFMVTFFQFLDVFLNELFLQMSVESGFHARVYLRFADRNCFGWVLVFCGFDCALLRQWTSFLAQ